MNIFTEIKNQLTELSKSISALVANGTKTGAAGSTATTPTAGAETAPELAALAATVGELTARVEQGETDLGTAKQTIGTLQKNIEAKDTEIAKLTDAATKHTAALEEKEKSVAARAKTQFEELAASQGLKPNAGPAAHVGGAGNGKSVETLWAEYATLGPEAKVAFYNAHKELHPK
ncbi:MAG TPA: hypothetical protein VNO50_10915 [Pyrinomonadaceae bacterium]|nr:hypothetical protein [Pyrinomonadaceae bacterium]